MNHVDRAPGVRLVTDRPVKPVPVSPELAALEDQLDPSLVALRGRLFAGLGVQLLWSPLNDRTYVTLVEGDREPVTFEVPKESANDAFEHPYVYDPRPR